MYKKLRIICAIISALFLVVIAPAAIIFNTNGVVICGFGAGLFFFLTLIFRKAQQKWEKKNSIVEEDNEIGPPAEEDNATENPAAENDETENDKADDIVQPINKKDESPKK